MGWGRSARGDWTRGNSGTVRAANVLTCFRAATLGQTVVGQRETSDSSVVPSTEESAAGQPQVTEMPGWERIGACRVIGCLAMVKGSSSAVGPRDGGRRLVRTHSGDRASVGRSSAVLALTALLGGVLLSSFAAANGDRLYLDCPCEIESDGSTLSVTAGVRSFRSSASRTLSLRAEARVRIEGGRASRENHWEVSVADSLAGGATLERTTYDVPIGNQASAAGAAVFEIVLYEQLEGDKLEQDRVRMEVPVDLSGAFQVAELDYLKDADGDGVGDVNERFEGTDPLDAQSTPGVSTIDVVAFYSQAFQEHYDGEGTARIQHLFVLADEMYRNSDVEIQLRLVGAVEIPVDEATGRNLVDPEYGPMQADRHGADLMVLFRPWAPNIGYCGIASLGGLGTRGHFDFEREGRSVAEVVGNCGASTLAHELGHVMGLGHSFWQDAVGTWRWSRGHGVDHDFGTVMSYGPPTGSGRWLEVFSGPRSLCTGALGEEKACGVEGEAVNGADAVTSLNAVRFQIAAFRESHPDSDNDRFVDPVDLFPNDPGDWWDADGDGVGDNADTDDDNDGVPDGEDAFPFDGSETTDTDGDGVGDNADAFPEDASEAQDADNDGVGDNADVFPDDPLESADSDGDGVGDNADPWPDNPDESADTDGDGVGDNADRDDDGDGVADDHDAFPLDAERIDLASYVFIGESAGDQAGEILSRAGNGDAASFLIGVPQHDVNGRENAGAVYLVSASDLATLDAADGHTDRVIGLASVVAGASSWKFVGEVADDQAGRSLVSSGDMDGDSHTDVIIGAPYHESLKGAAYFVSGVDFASADAADGVADRTIQLAHVASQTSSWKFVGEHEFDEAGISVASVADIDRDGTRELLIGAWGHDPRERSSAGATYLLVSSDLSSADATDGISDGVIDLGHVTGQSASWKLIGEAPDHRTGSPVSSPGDVDGDGNAEIAVHSQYRRAEQARHAGAVYLISVPDLAGADEADGQTDRIVELSHVAGQPNSWALINGSGSSWMRWPLSIVYDGVRSTTWLIMAGEVLSSAALLPADGADGEEDGIVDLVRLPGPPNSWKLGTDRTVQVGDMDGDGAEHLLATGGDRYAWVHYLFSTSILADASNLRRAYITRGALDLDTAGGVKRIFGAWPYGQTAVSAAGDADGDGVSDLLLGHLGGSVNNRPGAVYMLLGAELAALDRVDGTLDGRIFLGNVAGDTDEDGISNTFDRDDDGDGIPDSVDSFQLDPEEWADSDGDRVGDNADAFPNDFGESFDTDGDGLGDRFADDDDDGDGIVDAEDAYPLDTDNDGTENAVDPDDDGDGVPDTDDALPVDASEFSDTDGDGLGNNADTDDDNDGVDDDLDAFPLDPGESLDSDGDGAGDNGDAFPSDPNEAHDHDSDGIGDNADMDDDNDGILDADDEFPYDTGASTDTDGDGVADMRDAFPSDVGEWNDTDSDGVGDNADTDDDNGGVEDLSDLFPRDGSRWDLSSIRIGLNLTAQGAATRVASAGDLDGDAVSETLVPGLDAVGDSVVLVISPADLDRADSADGVRDGSAHMHHVLAGMHSWKLVGEQDYQTGTVLTPFGDLTKDGFGEFFVGASANRSAGYVISGADLLAVDASDGVADGVVDLAGIASQPGSWKLLGYSNGSTIQTTVPADLDGDGTVEIAIGQPGIRSGNSPGTVQVMSADALPMIDVLDGSMDGVVALKHSEGLEVWRLVGQAPQDRAGRSLTMADFNGDGHPDLVVGAPGNDAKRRNQGAVYLLDSEDLAPADRSDGSADRQVDLARAPAEPGSWKLLVGEAEIGLGSKIVAGDLNGDGRQDLLASSWHLSDRHLLSVVSGLSENLEGMDRADGADDGVIDLTGNASPHLVQVSGSSTNSLDNLGVGLTDFDGDGREDIVVAIRRRENSLVAYLIAASALFGDDQRATGGIVQADTVFARGGSYEIYAPEAQSVDAHVAIAAAGDVDADGLGDILLAVLPKRFTEQPVHGGVAYLIVGADLPPLDAADGRMDGRIFLSNVVRDRDGMLRGRQNELNLGSAGSLSGNSCFVCL